MSVLARGAGRPRIGPRVTFACDVQSEVDDWAAAHEVKQPEALRRLVRIALDAEHADSQTPTASKGSIMRTSVHMDNARGFAVTGSDDAVDIEFQDGESVVTVSVTRELLDDLCNELRAQL